VSRLGRIIPALLLLTAAWCQAAGRIEGTIRDGSQAVVPQTSIVCVAEDTGFRFQTHSDREGNYAVIVPDGAYNIIVRHPGFDSAARIGLLVPRAGTLHVDFELQPSSVSETVDVRDASESLGFAESAATILKPNALRGLPRNDGAVTGLLSLVPGVLSTPASRGEAGQFSSAGGRPNTNQFSVDGVSANNAVAGAGWPSFLPGGRLPEMTALGTTHALSMLDAIQEVRLETQGEGAGAAQTPGANIIIHTRSGTNHFHGSFFINARPQALGANDWFTNRYGLGSDAPGLHEEGGSLGGPLGKADSDNPTFFFASAERLSLQEGYAWTTTVPSRLARVLSPNSVLSLLNEFPVPNGPDLTPGISQLIGKPPCPLASRPAPCESIVSYPRPCVLFFATPIRPRGVTPA
jgi:hypothetical protein